MAEGKGELERWLTPFLGRLGHKTRQRMCPLYVAGLIGPGDRKSVQPMAERLATGNYDQLHHFIADGVWPCATIIWATSQTGFGCTAALSQRRIQSPNLAVVR